MTPTPFVDLFCGGGGRESQRCPNDTNRDTSTKMSEDVFPDTVTLENVRGVTL